MFDKIVQIILILLICSISSSSYLLPNRSTNPNILILFVDDLGYGDISYINNIFDKQYNNISTPNIDNLAKDGIYFTDAHSSSSVCTPSRYSLLTGRYNWRSTLAAGVLNGTSLHLIDENRSTIAKLLKKIILLQ